MCSGPPLSARCALLSRAMRRTRGGTKQDNLDGGANNDGFFAKDGVTDIVTGGTGTDHATMDFNFDRPSSIEEPIF